MFTQSAADLSATTLAQNGTQAFSFTLHGGRWHMQMPPNPYQKGPQEPSYLALGDAAWLQLLAGRRTHLTLLLDTEPFEGAEVLHLDELCTDKEGGAYYYLFSYGGRSRNRRIWICDISLCIFGDLPPQIFFKRVLKGSAQPATPNAPGLLHANQ